MTSTKLVSSHTRRLLAINFGGIGDEVLFLPALKTLRMHYPDAHITLLLEPRSRSIEQVTDLIDATITFDIKKRPLMVVDLLELLGILRDGAYDVVVSSGSSPMVSALLFMSGIRRRVGYNSNRAARMLLTDAVPLNRGQYAAHMYHDLAAGLTGYHPCNEKLIPEVTLSPGAVTAMEQLLSEEEDESDSPASSRSPVAAAEDSSQSRVQFMDVCAHGQSQESSIRRIKRHGDVRRVLVHPGTSKLALAKGVHKTWPVENWLALILKLARHDDIQVVLSGGPEDAEVLEELHKKIDHTRVISTFGKTRNLADLAALISVCDLLVCVDSGPMHIAVGCGKPLVALFGPTYENKLLPADKRFKALRGAETPTSEQAAQTPAALWLRPGAPAVQLQPDIVYQSVLDQLQANSDRASLQECRL